MKLGHVRYQAAINGVDVTQRMLECVWEHTTRELAERAMVEIALHPTKDDRVFASVGTGASLLLWADGAGVFQGRIEAIQFTEKRPVTLQVTAYAAAFTLGANEDDVSFPANYTTQHVVDHVFGRFGMPVGGIAWPNVSLGPAETYRAKTLAYIVEDTNHKLRMLGHGDYFVRSVGNGIEIVRGNPAFGAWAFTPQNTILMQDQESTQDLVTLVRFASSQMVYGGEAKIAAPQEFRNPRAPPSLYGVRQRIVVDAVAQGEEEAAAAAIFEQAGEPQRIQVFEAPDVPAIRKGDGVHFAVGTANGVLVLTGVHHDARRQVVRMEVDTTGKSRHRVSAKRQLPVYGADQPGRGERGGTPSGTGAPPAQ